MVFYLLFLAITVLMGGSRYLRSHIPSEISTIGWKGVIVDLNLDFSGKACIRILRRAFLTSAGWWGVDAGAISSSQPFINRSIGNWGCWRQGFRSTRNYPHQLNEERMKVRYHVVLLGTMAMPGLLVTYISTGATHVATSIVRGITAFANAILTAKTCPTTIESVAPHVAPPNQTSDWTRTRTKLRFRFKKWPGFSIDEVDRVHFGVWGSDAGGGKG